MLVMKNGISTTNTQRFITPVVQKSSEVKLLKLGLNGKQEASKIITTLKLNIMLYSLPKKPPPA